MSKACMILIVAAVAAGLAGCSGETPERTVFDDKTSAIDKAKDVNALIDETAAAQRRAIDEQSQ